ncbi:hypothetical protein Hypma_012611 [Hypsizygus marmoreus]|uniref:Uncharacterized protein n=1 Tax=Hypsizygus marmoreus TaxID=39966 RepID=A0A369JIU4_HYPMA|nr:hypothetical protein Hypma_012611 [Hypsizygus marmoreus]
MQDEHRDTTDGERSTENEDCENLKIRTEEGCETSAAGMRSASCPPFRFHLHPSSSPASTVPPPRPLPYPHDREHLRRLERHPGGGAARRYAA